MANRHLLRSLAMQTLFEWDFNNYAASFNLTKTLDRLGQEFAPGVDDIIFAKKLAEGVLTHRDKLDHIIAKAAPDWPLSQIASVDRTIIRLGLFELLFGNKEEVPARVAINEAIELAKTFGGENSGRFVNGVLGAVYKEMGEPGKDDVPAKKKFPKDVPFDQMPIKKLGGAVVYCYKDGNLELALVHDVFGYWTLSKGKIDLNEAVEAGTIREIKEELNLDIKITASLGQNEYVASNPDEGKIRKQVTYFLAEALNPAQIKVEEGKGGLNDAKWFPVAEIPDLKIYDDILPIITKAITILNQ